MFVYIYKRIILKRVILHNLKGNNRASSERGVLRCLLRWRANPRRNDSFTPNRMAKITILTLFHSGFCGVPGPGGGGGGGGGASKVPPL